MFIDVFMMRRADATWCGYSINIYGKEERKGGRKKGGGGGRDRKGEERE